jgi:hypothetical protein
LQNDAPRIANGGMTGKEEGSVVVTRLTAAALAEECQRDNEKLRGKDSEC